MPFKFLHTADLHIGMAFGNRGYPQEVQERLVEARYQALERLVELAGKEQCRLMIIAGDLFHRTNITPQAVARVLGILNRFQGCVALLPGNHDYYDPYGTLWKELKEGAFDQLVLLTEMRPYLLREQGIEAVLYPAPCDRKHSADNRLGWIAGLGQRAAGRWHIGVAHGSVQGCSPDFADQYFPMTEAELAGLGLDHWCLGHTHGRIPDLEESGRRPFFYSGTPEPDGFDCRHGGHAWIVGMDEGGGSSCRSVETGRYRFREISRQLESAAGLEELHRELAAAGARQLVKLRLTGTLPEEDFNRRHRWYEKMQEALLYLEKDDSELAVEITAGVIASLFPAESFPHRLLNRLEKKGDREALQLAYRLISEVKK